MGDIVDGSTPSSQRKRKNIDKLFHTSQKVIKRDLCNINDAIDRQTKNLTSNVQSDFTQSQLHIIQNATITANNNEPTSSFVQPRKIRPKENAISNDSDHLVVRIAPARAIDSISEDTLNTTLNSAKRQRSIMESILNEWPTSPVKKKKAPSEQIQCSPKFKFDRRKTIRTYRAKRKLNDAKKSIPDLKTQSPAIASRCNALLPSDDQDENMPIEICQKEIHPMNLNDEGVDIIDNIQNFVGFYSQSTSGAIVNDVNEKFKAIMDGKCESLNKASQSLKDEEDFAGFDNKFVTLSQRFYDFASDSDDVASTHSTVNQHQDIFADDDEDILFMNFNTQLIVPLPSTSTTALKDDLFRKNVSRDSNSDKDSRSVAYGDTNLFEDIENDFNVAAPNECFRLSNDETNPTPLSDTVSNVKPITAFPGFSTAAGKQIPVSTALITKKTNIFQNVEVTEGDVSGMNHWIGNNERHGNRLSESAGTVSNVKPITAFPGFSTAAGKQIPVSTALITKKTNIFQNVEVTEGDVSGMNHWIGNNERHGNRLSESAGTVSNVKPITAFPGFSSF